MQLQEKYIPKSTGRVHLFIGERYTGKSSAIRTLLYSIRNHVSRCIAFGHRMESYHDIISDTRYIDCDSQELSQWYQGYQRNRSTSKSRQVVIFDDVLYQHSDNDILYEIINNPMFFIIIALQFHAFPYSISARVDMFYMFKNYDYFLTRIEFFRIYCQGKVISIEEYRCQMETLFDQKDRFGCMMCDKSKTDVAYVEFALIQDMKENESQSAQIVQKWFRGWRFRKEVLWNPHTDIGGRYLELKARKYC